MKGQKTQRLAAGWLFGMVLLIAVSAASLWARRGADLERQLLRSEPQALMTDAQLVKFARGRAGSLFQQRCSSCHGGQARGGVPNRAGVPNLASARSLYGDNLIDIERIVLYGIRSGHPLARNLTDMPALGRMGQITADEAHDVVEYLLRLSRRTHDDAAAERGSAVFRGNGNCYDCHANDAAGVTDYGTPALTGPGWLYGGDRQSLYESVYSGRHGLCPAHTRVLSAADARALAVYVLMMRRTRA